MLLAATGKIQIMSASNLNQKDLGILDKANNILAYNNWHIIYIFSFYCY
jgi:hypothetical protein